MLATIILVILKLKSEFEAIGCVIPGEAEVSTIETGEEAILFNVVETVPNL